MAEAVMMGLAPKLGREAAHHAVKHATDKGGSLADALMQEPDVSAHMSRPDIDRLTDPASYLGAAQSFIDRVLARAQKKTGP